MNAIKSKDKYHNLKNIKMAINLSRTKGMIKDYVAKKDATPSFEIPRKVIDKDRFLNEDSFVWLGHSTILANLQNVSFIVDPMLGLRASPVAFAGPKRFKGSLTPLEELPNIDVVLITHNHYDHLDKGTILALNKKVKHFFVPLDNAKRVIGWGVDKAKIKEFDWFEEITHKGVTFAFCPTQHFSGRALNDRDKALWGSWAVKSKNHSIYISGDSGYNDHFSQIGKKYGKFDIACMECGAYNENWSEIHMTPEQSVQSTKDINANVMLPMHWAGFDLSTHAWDEPITRALVEAKNLNMQTTTPMIGEVLSFKNPMRSKKWWRKNDFTN